MSWIHRSPANSPHKGQWCRTLICISTKSWANPQDAGDLRCHHICYDVTVMWSKIGHVSLVAITGNTVLVPYQEVKFLQHIQRLRNHSIWFLMSCSDFTKTLGTRMIVPAVAARVTWYISANWNNNRDRNLSYKKKSMKTLSWEHDIDCQN